MLAYLSEYEAHHTAIAKLTHIVGYFQGTFGSIWRARVEHGVATPRFSFDGVSANFDVNVFRNWFTTYNADHAGNIRARKEFFEYQGTWLTLDRKLKDLKIMMQWINAHLDAKQDHITQKEFWDKYEVWCPRDVRKDCIRDPKTKEHVELPNIQPYYGIEEHVLTHLRLEVLLLQDNNIAAERGFQILHLARLHNIERQDFVEPKEVLLNSMNNNAEGDDFLFNMWQPLDDPLKEDVAELTAIPCVSLEEANDLAHVAQFNSTLNSFVTSNYREQRSRDI